MNNSELILVTGATGNLGNVIVKQLVEQGRNVRCLVRDIERAKPILPDNVELVQGDLIDKESIHSAMKGVAIVYHAGGIPEQWQKDVRIFEQVNTRGTRWMIEAALNESVERFIYTSTQDVFDFTKGSFDESTVHSRLNCSAYELSKLLAQDLIDKAVKEDGLAAVSIHPVAIYGPCGAKPTGLTRLMDELRTNKIPVLLKGGLPVVFNEDVARAHILAETKAAIGEKYIVAEAYYTLKEIAEKVSQNCSKAKIPKMMPDFIANFIAFIGKPISKLTKKPPLITRSELNVLRRMGKPNCSRIENDLGWKTTSFDVGVKKTIEALSTLDN